MIVYKSNRAWFEVFKEGGVNTLPSRTMSFTYEWDGETLLANGVVLGKRDCCGLLRVQCRLVPLLVGPRTRYLPTLPFALSHTQFVVYTGDVFVPLSIDRQREEWLRYWRGKMRWPRFHYLTYGFRGIERLNNLSETQHLRLCEAMAHPYTRLTPWPEVLAARAALTLTGRFNDGVRLEPLPEDLV